MLPDFLSQALIVTNRAGMQQAILLRIENFSLKHDCVFNYVRTVRGSICNFFESVLSAWS